MALALLSTSSIRLLFLGLFLLLAPSLAQEDDKRSVATLARNGDLPKLRQEIKKFVHPIQAWQTQQQHNKRLIHPLATTMQDKQQATQQQYFAEKRFSHPMMLPIPEALKLREENKRGFVHPVTWQRQMQEAMEKRYVGSLARTGNLGKRDEEISDEMAAQLIADAIATQLLEQEQFYPKDDNDDYFDKRNVGSIARTGNLPSKRNIAAMARDGYLQQHGPSTQSDKTDDDVIDETVNDDINTNNDVDSIVDEIGKRHLGALVRAYNMPEGLTSGGKRNVGSLARSGLLSKINNNQGGEDKRNIASYLRSRYSGKRSYYRGNYLPFAYARLSGIRESFVDPGKRNIQALLKQWRPSDQYSSGNGKKYPIYYLRTNEIPSTRRYIAALMHSPARVLGQQKDGHKRHLGSVLGVTRQKKSINLTGADSNNKKNNKAASRHKREAPLFDEIMLGSIEYPIPVLQGSDFYDYEEDFPLEEKRFLGRIPHMGVGRNLGRNGHNNNNGGAGGSRRRGR